MHPQFKQVNRSNSFTPAADFSPAMPIRQTGQIRGQGPCCCSMARFPGDGTTIMGLMKRLFLDQGQTGLRRAIRVLSAGRNRSRPQSSRTAASYRRLFFIPTTARTSGRLKTRSVMEALIALCRRHADLHSRGSVGHPRLNARRQRRTMDGLAPRHRRRPAWPWQRPLDGLADESADAGGYHHRKRPPEGHAKSRFEDASPTNLRAKYTEQRQEH